MIIIPKEVFVILFDLGSLHSSFIRNGRMEKVLREEMGQIGIALRNECAG
jgi:hypothetical protein